MTKETVFKLLKKMFDGGDINDTLLIQPKHGSQKFVKISWLQDEFDVESPAYMPECFMFAESEEDPIYFMEYDEIAWIRW